MSQVRIFLSAVSPEFRSYRQALRRVLQRTGVTLMVREDFISSGMGTLEAIDGYIRSCHAVIHLVGDMSGEQVPASALIPICARYPYFGLRLPLGPFLRPDGPTLSSTQWDAWLALYHRKLLLIATPEPGAARDVGYREDVLQQAAQQAHLQRLAALGHVPEIHFPDAIHLVVDVMNSPVRDILALADQDLRPSRRSNGLRRSD